MRGHRGQKHDGREVGNNLTQNLDAVIWGAEAIGQAADVLEDDGTVDRGRIFYLLSHGHIDATKVGGRWCSTLRRIRTSLGIIKAEAA